MAYGAAEMMCVALARELREGEVVFHGLASPVPMTATKLAKALGRQVTVVSIAGGVDPDWTKPATVTTTVGPNQFEGAVADYGLDEVFDLAATDRLDVTFLSFLQISPRGEINMSFVGGCYDKPKVRFPGGAGSATLIPVTKRTVIWRTKHDRRSLVEEVEFATTAADPEKEFVVVTPLCIFRMADGVLKLESVFPYSSLDEVKANTGWHIDLDEVPTSDPPSEEELVLLERVDPHGMRNIEF